MAVVKGVGRPPKNHPKKPSAEELRKEKLQSELSQQQSLRELREELSRLSFAELRAARDTEIRGLRFLGMNPDFVTNAIQELCATEAAIRAKAKALVMSQRPDWFFRILRSQE